MKIERMPVGNHEVVIGLGDKSDGDMRLSGQQKGEDCLEHMFNIQAFLGRCGLDMTKTVLYQPTYEGSNYCRYQPAETAGPIRCDVDGLVTQESGLGLMIQPADCQIAVIGSGDWLMSTHLGRQSIEQEGALRSIEYLNQVAGGIALEETKVWLSPCASRGYYPLHQFDDRGIQEMNLEHLVTAGVLPENIQMTRVFTTPDDTYFSHSQEMKRGAHQSHTRRFGVVAQMVQNANIIK